jgi:hypothetical protein
MTRTYVFFYYYYYYYYYYYCSFSKGFVSVLSAWDRDGIHLLRYCHALRTIHTGFGLVIGFIEHS